MRLSEALGISFKVRESDKRYDRGWGFEGLGSLPVACSWSITIQEVQGLPTTFDFDLFEDNSPLIIGLDLKRYSNTENFSHDRMFKFRRRHDTTI